MLRGAIVQCDACGAMHTTPGVVASASPVSLGWVRMVPSKGPLVDLCPECKETDDHPPLPREVLNTVHQRLISIVPNQEEPNAPKMRYRWFEDRGKHYYRQELGKAPNLASRIVGTAGYDYDAKCWNAKVLNRQNTWKSLGLYTLAIACLEVEKGVDSYD